MLSPSNTAKSRSSRFSSCCSSELQLTAVTNRSENRAVIGSVTGFKHRAHGVSTFAVRLPETSTAPLLRQTRPLTLTVSVNRRAGTSRESSSGAKSCANARSFSRFSSSSRIGGAPELHRPRQGVGHKVANYSGEHSAVKAALTASGRLSGSFPCSFGDGFFLGGFAFVVVKLVTFDAPHLFQSFVIHYATLIQHFNQALHQGVITIRRFRLAQQQLQTLLQSFCESREGILQNREPLEQMLFVWCRVRTID